MHHRRCLRRLVVHVVLILISGRGRLRAARFFLCRRHVQFGIHLASYKVEEEAVDEARVREDRRVYRLGIILHFNLILINQLKARRLISLGFLKYFCRVRHETRAHAKLNRL